MKKVVLLVDYFGKWVDDKISWRWNSQNDTVRTMLVSGDVTFDNFMESIIRRGELSCGHDRICVKYMTNAGAFSRDKAPPVEIMNDEDAQIYLNNINGEGGRTILRVSSIEKSLESGCGLSNHQSEDVLSSRVEKEVPRDNEDVLPCQVENDISLDNENVLPCQVERDGLLDNEVDVQLPELLNDATIRSHQSYIFSDGSGFRKGYRFLNKEDAVTKLNLVAIRKGFEFTIKKSSKSLLIVVCVEKSYKWKVRIAKFLISDAFRITRYAPNHSCKLRSIEKANKGRFTALEVQEGRFLYFFVAYGPCIRGFKNIRNFLAVDGTFLTGQFGGVTLIASGQDSENQIYPVAWALVDSENELSRTWFFHKLVNVVPNTSELSITLDRNPSIKKAVAIVYNQAHHGVLKTYRIEEFNECLEEIRRKGYGNVVEYLENIIGFKRWSRAHFPGHRWFCERRGLTLSTNNYLAPATNALVRETRREIADKLSVHQLHVNEFIVQGDGQDARVNINAKTCTCRVWDLQQLPCTHALAALRAQRLSNYGERVYNVCSPYYSADFHKLAYSEIINPVHPEEQWDWVRESIINPPLVKRKIGPRKKMGSNCW
ncbi:hypothetical protein P3L10_005206 [Capsicum annuum]